MLLSLTDLLLERVEATEVGGEVGSACSVEERRGVEGGLAISLFCIASVEEKGVIGSKSAGESCILF